MIESEAVSKRFAQWKECTLMGLHSTFTGAWHLADLSNDLLMTY